MRITMKTKFYPLIALIIFIGAVFFYGAAAVRADGDDLVMEIESWLADNDALHGGNRTPTPSLTVDEVWLIGDELNIAVTDKNSGEKQIFVLALSDYALPVDEFVTIQAIDNTGRVSEIICFKNPYYTPSELPDDGEDIPPGDYESAVPDENRPLTPDGTGSVVDNVTDGDGKEFFTVETPDGNMFYLIVDRQRNSENVYLLNAVTENDLFSLAEPGNGSVSAVQTPEPVVVVEQPEPEPVIEPEPEPAKKNGNTGNIMFLLIALIIGGGAGYYFKILKPKQYGSDDYEDNDDSSDYGNRQGVDETEEYELTDDDKEAL